MDWGPTTEILPDNFTKFEITSFDETIITPEYDGGWMGHIIDENKVNKMATPITCSLKKNHTLSILNEEKSNNDTEILDKTDEAKLANKKLLNATEWNFFLRIESTKIQISSCDQHETLITSEYNGGWMGHIALIDESKSNFRSIHSNASNISYEQKVNGTDTEILHYKKELERMRDIIQQQKDEICKLKGNVSLEINMRPLVEEEKSDCNSRGSALIFGIPANICVQSSIGSNSTRSMQTDWYSDHESKQYDLTPEHSIHISEQSVNDINSKLDAQTDSEPMPNPYNGIINNEILTSLSFIPHEYNKLDTMISNIGSVYFQNNILPGIKQRLDDLSQELEALNWNRCERQMFYIYFSIWICFIAHCF